VRQKQTEGTQEKKDTEREEKGPGSNDWPHACVCAHTRTHTHTVIIRPFPGALKDSLAEYPLRS
jgi:hypothetical protein